MENQSKSRKDIDAISSTFINNFLRGSIKTIPALGAFLEQLIWGIIDDKKAKEEKDKLYTTLSRIDKKVTKEDIDLKGILKDVVEQAGLLQETVKEIKQVINFLNNPADTEIPRKLQDVVLRMYIHNLPFWPLGNLFKGREEILKKLEVCLENRRTVSITQVQAMHGLGGIGKTRVAIEYAWKAIEEGRCSAAFFVTADTIVDLNKNLASLANSHLLNLPERNYKQFPMIVEAVLRELERRRKWLLIFDNVDDEILFDHLFKMLPRLSHGKVLLTSRISNWPDGIIDIPINKLNIPDSVAYLLEKTEGKRQQSAEGDRRHAEMIARQLDGLPLALEQAAAYINYHRIGLPMYLHDFKESEKTILSWHKSYLINYPQPVLIALRTTEKHLDNLHKAIMRIIAFLSTEPIPIHLLASHSRKIDKAIEMMETQEKQPDPAPYVSG